jgi:hypothetical protein
MREAKAGEDDKQAECEQAATKSPNSSSDEVPRFGEICSNDKPSLSIWKIFR